jgi:hypothetical protein
MYQQTPPERAPTATPPIAEPTLAVVSLIGLTGVVTKLVARTSNIIFLQAFTMICAIKLP